MRQSLDDFDSLSSSPPPPPPPPPQSETEEEYISLDNFEDGLPYPLERHYSKEDERYYIFNTETNECWWEDELLENDDEFQDDENFDEEQLQQYENELDEYEDQYVNQDNQQEMNEKQYDYYENSQDKLLQKYMDNTDLLNELENSADPESNNDNFSLVDLAQFELDDYSYKTDTSQAMSVVDRSNLMLQNKFQKIAQIKYERDVLELQELKLQPKLTKKSQQIQRSVNDMFSWEEQRKQKLTQKTREKEEQERAQQTGRPMVTKKAQTIAKRWQQSQQHQQQQPLQFDEFGEEVSILSGSPARDNTKQNNPNNNTDSPGSGTQDGNRSIAGYSMTSMGSKSVQDRLYDYDVKRKQKIAFLKSQQEKEARALSNPKINANTDRLLQSRKFVIYNAHGYPQEEGDESTANASVTDRLYALAQLQHRSSQEQSISEERDGMLLAHGKLVQHDPNTGQRLFEPKINRISKQLALQRAARRSTATLHMSIEDQLQLQGQLYQQKLLTRQQKKEYAFQEHTRQSKINPKSAQMIQEKEMLTGETTQDRLMKPIKQSIKAKTLETIPKLTFHPKINETSQAILSQSGKSYYARYTYIPPADLTDQTNNGQHHTQGYPHHQEDDYYPVGEAVCVDDIQSVHSNIPITLLPPDLAYGYGYPPHGGGGDDRKTTHQGSSSSSSSTTQDSTIYNRTLYWRDQREKRLYYERLAKEKEEQEQCTFRPKVTPNNIDTTNRKSIADRHAEWIKKREDKLSWERQKQEEDELKDCTFVPKVPLPLKSSISIQNSVSSTVPTAAVNTTNVLHSESNNGTGYSQRFASSSGQNTPERITRKGNVVGPPPPLPASNSVKGILRTPSLKSNRSMHSSSYDFTDVTGGGDYISSSNSVSTSNSQGNNNNGNRRVRIQLEEDEEQVGLGADEVEDRQEYDHAIQGKYADEMIQQQYHQQQQQQQQNYHQQQQQSQHQQYMEEEPEAEAEPKQEAEEEEGQQLTYEQLEELHRYQLKYQQQQQQQQQMFQQQRQQISQQQQPYYDNYGNHYAEEYEQSHPYDTQYQQQPPSSSSSVSYGGGMRSQHSSSSYQQQPQSQSQPQDRMEYLYQDEAGNLIPVSRFQPPSQHHQIPQGQSPVRIPIPSSSNRVPIPTKPIAFHTNSAANMQTGSNNNTWEQHLHLQDPEQPLQTRSLPRFSMNSNSNNMNTAASAHSAVPPVRSLVHPGSRLPQVQPSAPVMQVKPNNSYSVNNVNNNNTDVSRQQPTMKYPTSNNSYSASFDAFDDNMSQAYEIE